MAFMCECTVLPRLCYAVRCSIPSTARESELGPRAGEYAGHDGDMGEERGFCRSTADSAARGLTCACACASVKAPTNR